MIRWDSAFSSCAIEPVSYTHLGYQFSPVCALRLQANGWQSKGGWNGYELARTGNPYTADYKFNYVAPGLDLMFNLSNLFCGWNPCLLYTSRCV